MVFLLAYKHTHTHTQCESLTSKRVSRAAVARSSSSTGATNTHYSVSRGSNLVKAHTRDFRGVFGSVTCERPMNFTLTHTHVRHEALHRDFNSLKAQSFECFICKDCHL